ncbi:MAG: LamG domain-containing protein [Solirubrobacteraceae bacterium]
MLNRLPLAALVLVIAALTAAPALGATGPVGIWTLDEGSGTTVTDGSGNGNNGVLSGGTTWVPGISGSAVGFDGFSGQIKVEDNDALEPAGAITVSAWVKHAGSPGTYRYIVAKGGNGCIAASYGLYSGPSGGLQFYVSQHHGSVYARSPDAGQGIWDGNWHLAVGTYDGTTIRLYVDGVEVGSGTAWTGALEYLLPSSNDFYIGNYPSCQDHWFAGAIDDVMVWGRALSASEISAMVPGSSNPTGPNPPSTPGAGGG